MKYLSGMHIIFINLSCKHMGNITILRAKNDEKCICLGCRYKGDLVMCFSPISLNLKHEDTYKLSFKRFGKQKFLL